MAGLRKRIKSVSNEIYDPLKFSPNGGSENARIYSKIAHSTEIELWFDKHYFVRLQHGDENGKRDGIDIETVSKLIERAFGFLVVHSLRVEKFNFLNFLEHRNNSFKVVVQELTNNQMLNVAIECHFIEPSVYEITVKTAMVTEHFRIRDGQFLLEIVENNSILKRLINGNIIEISRL